jgi:hypothetical protein
MTKRERAENELELAQLMVQLAYKQILYNDWRIPFNLHSSAELCNKLVEDLDAVEYLYECGCETPLNEVSDLFTKTARELEDGELTPRQLGARRKKILELFNDGSLMRREEEP